MGRPYPGRNPAGILPLLIVYLIVRKQVTATVVKLSRLHEEFARRVTNPQIPETPPPPTLPPPP